MTDKITRRKAVIKARRKARQAFNDYVTTRRAYREQKATIAELAQALAASDLADAKLAVAASRNLNI
jgi:ABC-type transporter lipoprotein component MlaA